MSQQLTAFRALITLAMVIVMAIIHEAKKDGFQWTDLFAFLSSEEFKEKVGPTIQQMPQITEEFKNFNASSGFEIARIATDVGEVIYNEVTKKDS